MAVEVEVVRCGLPHRWRGGRDDRLGGTDGGSQNAGGASPIPTCSLRSSADLWLVEQVEEEAGGGATLVVLPGLGSAVDGVVVASGGGGGGGTTVVVKTGEVVGGGGGGAGITSFFRVSVSPYPDAHTQMEGVVVLASRRSRTGKEEAMAVSLNPAAEA